MLRIKRLIVMLLVIALLPAFPALADNTTYVIGIDKTNQIVTIYLADSGEIVRQMICSTSFDRDYTYKLSYEETVYDRKDWYYLHLFHCYVRYATRIVDSIMFHSVPYLTKSEDGMDPEALASLGEPVSHGCVRLYTPDAKFIAENCPAGTKCRIYASGKRNEYLRELLLAGSYTGENGQTYDEFLGKTTVEGELGYESEGEDVTALQKRMRALGLYSGEADGSYDGTMVLAIRALQKELGQTQTGIVTPELMEIINGDTVSVGLETAFTVGESGPAVTALQENLAALKLYDGEFNGVFDEATLAAFNRFRAGYGEFPSETAASVTQKAIYYEAGRVRAEFALNSDYTLSEEVENITMAKVTSEVTVRVRNKPNTEGNTVFRVSNGDYLMVEAQSDGWSQVTNGKSSGYIKDDFITTASLDVARYEYTGTDDGRQYTIGYTMAQYMKGATRPCKAFSTYLEKGGSLDDYEGFSQYASVTVDEGIKLNLREQPNSEATVLATLENGTAVRILTQVGDWARVQVNGQIGYLLSTYLSFYMAPEDADVGTEIPDDEITSIYAQVTSGLSKAAVYKEDSADSIVLGHLSGDTKVEVLECVGGWCKITLEGHTGYMLEEDLDITY